MLQWNSMHPYNAVHVVQVPGTPDRDRLQRAINGTIEAHALAGLTLDGDHRSFCYAGGPARCEIKYLHGSGNLRASLAAEIECQLNTPFAQIDPFSPFRFFVAPDRDSFFLGLAYLHAVADAEAIVRLIKEIIQCYTGSRERAHLAPAAGPIPTPANLLLSHPEILLRKLASLPAATRNLRRSCRPHYRDKMDLNNGFALFSLESTSLRRLVETGKSLGVTVNDLLLALLLKSCALLSTERVPAAKRNKISVGCIVNTRKDLGLEAQGVFGLFLGSFVVTHALPEPIPLTELAKDIGRMTLEFKRKRLYLASPLELSIGRFVFSFFSTERRKKLYQTYYPLWGGLTNMNVNSLWPQPEQGAPFEYLRAVSTGPATPLVLSFTTAGQAANIGLSYRSTVFLAADIDRLIKCFTGMIAELEVRC